MSRQYVPDRELNPPEDNRPKVYECSACEGPIRDGDGYYIVNGDYYCEDCVERNHYYAYADDYDWEDDE